MRNFPRRHPWILAAALLIFIPAIALGQEKLQRREHEGASSYHYVFLFDVSGSMNETGKLRAANSPTRQYLAQHIFANPEMFHEGQPASVYTFTVKCRREFSGPLRYSTVQNMLLTGLPITHENTDLIETLRTAEAEHAQNAKGGITLAWILTDNANDPAGNGPDEVNTRSFYAEMFREESLAQRMYFFPLKDLKLVLYLLVFAPDASLQGMDIDAFEDSLVRFARALGAPKIRAKPVGGERPLELAGLTSDEEGVMAEMISSGAKGLLRVKGLKEGKPLNGIFRLHVRSRFDEWRVEAAQVEAVSLQDLQSEDFPNIAGKAPARLSPRDVSVDPRMQTTKVYTLDLGEGEDQAPEAPFFTPAALNPDNYGVIRGKLVIKIGDPRLTLKIFNDPATTQAMESVFRLRDIEYFVPKSAAGKAMRLDLAIPVEFDVGYNSLPRWAALGGVFLVLAGGTTWLLLGRRNAVECRLIGYQEDTFRLMPASAFPIAPSGARVAELRKSMFGQIVCKGMPGVIVNGRPAARVGNGSPIEIKAGEAEYSYRLEVLSRRPAVHREEATPQSGGFY